MLFIRPPFHGRVLGAWPWARRIILALLSTEVLAIVAAGILSLIDVTSPNLIAGAVGLVVTSLPWLPVTRSWSARAHLCWSATTYLFVGYLVFMLWWPEPGHRKMRDY
jgi:hypothetical protein